MKKVSYRIKAKMTKNEKKDRCILKRRTRRRAKKEDNTVVKRRRRRKANKKTASYQRDGSQTDERSKGDIFPEITRRGKKGCFPGDHENARIRSDRDNLAEGRYNPRKELCQRTPEVVTITMRRVVVTLERNYANVHRRWSR